MFDGEQIKSRKSRDFHMRRDARAYTHPHGSLFILIDKLRLHERVLLFCLRVYPFRVRPYKDGRESPIPKVPRPPFGNSIRSQSRPSKPKVGMQRKNCPPPSTNLVATSHLDTLGRVIESRMSTRSNRLVI